MSAGIDIHKMIGKLPGHHYTGPYNDLNSQQKYDLKTGEILEIYDQPTAETDLIAMQHDVDYSVSKDDRKCKNKADRKMVKALDNVPYNVLLSMTWQQMMLIWPWLIYTRQKKTIQLFSKIFFYHLSDFNCHDIVIVGDFNLVLDLEKDERGELSKTIKIA